MFKSKRIRHLSISIYRCNSLRAVIWQALSPSLLTPNLPPGRVTIGRGFITTEMPPFHPVYSSSSYPVIVVDWNRSCPLAWTPALAGQKVPSLTIWGGIALIVILLTLATRLIGRKRQASVTNRRHPDDSDPEGGNLSTVALIHKRSDCPKKGHPSVADCVILYGVKNNRRLTNIGTLRVCVCTTYRCRRGHGKRDSQANRS